MFSTKPDLPRGRPAHAWTIAGRLSSIHAWKTLVVLAAAGGVLYLGLGRELQRQDAKLVESKLTVLAHLVLTYPMTSEAVASEIKHEAGGEGPLRYYLRILDATGRVLLETPGMPSDLPVDAFPALRSSSGPTAHCDDCVASRAGRYLVASRTIMGLGNSGPLGLHVALDVERTTVVLRRYAWLLAIVLGVGVILSALASRLVARVAVRPVHDIARQVRAITVNRLAQPALSSNPWPVELQGLASDFDEMLARLGDTFDRLSGFDADLAHALRNPINNLRGSTEVTLARSRTPEEYQQALGSNLEELERLSRLIAGLLFIARSEDPRQAIQRSSFSVRRELDAVQEFYEALAAEHGVTTVCEGNAEIVGDPMLFRRAVRNLLANALKHTPRGGSISMTAESRPDGGVLVIVRDSGEGMAAAHLPHVFDRFYRAHEVSGGDTAGIGLGLAIVQSIMRLHGGTVSITSEVGVGTTVTLRFEPAYGRGGASESPVPPRA